MKQVTGVGATGVSCDIFCKVVEFVEVTFLCLGFLVCVRVYVCVSLSAVLYISKKWQGTV